jgi:hypothetical protein
MKTQKHFFILTILFVITIIGCKKKETVIIPTLTTSLVTEITSTTASCGGAISSDSGADVTSKGICWSTNQNPTISDNKTADGSGAGSFTSNLASLIPNLVYYVRAYATNTAGTGYGNSVSFKTILVTDVDGNVYHAIKIGTQIWMLENLKVTKYNDGSSIPLVTDTTTWSNLSTPAYCWYNNDLATNKDTYGALYNWYAVNSGNLCPTGCMFVI